MLILIFARHPGHPPSDPRPFLDQQRLEHVVLFSLLLILCLLGCIVMTSASSTN